MNPAAQDPVAPANAVAGAADPAAGAEASAEASAADATDPAASPEDSAGAADAAAGPAKPTKKRKLDMHHLLRCDEEMDEDQKAALTFINKNQDAAWKDWLNENKDRTTAVKKQRAAERKANLALRMEMGKPPKK